MGSRALIAREHALNRKFVLDSLEILDHGEDRETSGPDGNWI